MRTRLFAPCQANSGLLAAAVSATAPFFKKSRRRIACLLGIAVDAPCAHIDCVIAMLEMKSVGVYTRFPEQTTNRSSILNTESTEDAEHR